MTGATFNHWTVIGPAETRRLRVSGQTKTYYPCRCVCGTEKPVYKNSLTSGKSKSCGCKSAGRKPFGEAHKRNVFATYKCGAARMGREFALTDAEFRDLISSPCFYCGSAPRNMTYKTNLNGCVPYNGIDRVDNSGGYVSSNVVTACKNCNLAKRSLSQHEFLEMVRRIYERHCA